MKLFVALVLVLCMSAPAGAQGVGGIVDDVTDFVDEIIGVEPEPQPQQAPTSPPAQPERPAAPAPQPARPAPARTVFVEPAAAQPARTAQPTPSVTEQTQPTLEPTPEPTQSGLAELEDSITSSGRPYIIVLAVALLFVIGTLAFFVAGRTSGARGERVAVFRRLAEIVDEPTARKIVEEDLRDLK